jgi:glutamate-1-semialdehyde 2,1-aminomutase
VQTFYTEVMRRKKDDHHASHSDLTNQLFHIISSSVFLGCYALAFWDLTTAMWAGLGALFLRQMGHAILEPPCHDKEALLLGFNTRNKTLILVAYLAIPVVHLLRAPAFAADVPGPIMGTIAQQWFLWTLAVVLGRVLYLIWAHNLWLALVWFIKLVTDPLTDIAAYSPRYLRRS